MGHTVTAAMSEPISDLLTRAFSNPADALATAASLLDAATPEERCQLLRVMGNSSRELRQMNDSVASLEEAVGIAISIGNRQLEGNGSMSLAATLSYVGDFNRAVEAAERAVELLDGDERLTAMSQRAGILRRAGRHDEALEAFAEALDSATTAADQTIRGDLWMNRGVLYGFLGDIDAGENDTQRAHDLFVEMGWTKRAVDMRHNLAWLAGRRGDVVEALRRFDESLAGYESLGISGASVFPDRCEVLIAAGLFDEALAVAELSAKGLDRLGDEVDLAEALLLVARAALLSANPDRALEASEQAAAIFLERGRRSWWPAATSLALEANLHLGHVDAADHDHALTIVEAAKQSGLRTASLEASVLAAEVALALEDWPACEHDLAGITRSDLGLATRFRLDLVRARLLMTKGEHREALDHCARSIREFTDISAGLGGTELRAHVALHIEALADFGLDLAVADGEVHRILEFAERQRATALAAPPLRPPADPDLERDLNALRSAMTELEQLVQDGLPSAAAAERCARHQDRVRRRTRHLSGENALGHDLRPLLAVSEEADAAWVVFVESGQRLVAITIEDGQPSASDVGSSSEIGHYVALLQSDLSRHLRAVGRGVDRDASRLAFAAMELDALLFSALEISAARIVICPTASIYNLPWGLLPTLRSTSFVLAPSIALFRRSNDVKDASQRSVLVAGPGLSYADDEVAAISSVYRSCEEFVGDDATVSRVRTAIEGAQVAHLVCHGHFATRSPLFSSLTLHDGPLFAHELERLQPPPAVAVLSACHGGLHAMRAGREILGLTVSLLSSGSRSVVAATVPIPDTVSVVTMMRSMHASLALGSSVADALRDVRALDPILAGAFSCHGAGLTV
jgi:tetratricopeptide (TPR) repeat protein